MRFPQLRFAASLLFFIAFEFSCAALAANSSSTAKLPKIIAVQERPYQLKKELSLSASYLPLDYFNTYWSLGGSYTYYFNDYLGWEVVNGSSTFNNSTGLETYLSKFQALTDPPDVLQWYGTTNLVYTPIYMKNLYLKNEIIWGDISFVAGYGTSHFKISGNVGTLDFGVMFRYIKSTQSSIKFDLRQLMYLSGGNKPNLAIGLVYSFNFSDFERKPLQEIEQ